jgi:ABC-type transporter Mla MlaB component
MLRITEQRESEPDSVLLRLEGRLTGPWVHELSGYWQKVSTNQQQRVMIDLTGVTFIDAEGKALLTRLWRQGAGLRAAGCLTKCVVEEITELDRSDPSKKNCSKRASSVTED